MLTCLLTVLLFSLAGKWTNTGNCYATSIQDRLLDAKTAIKYVNDVRKGNCTGGTENTLKLQFDHRRWENFARIAVKTANLLSKLIQRNNGTLLGVDEAYLFSLVRNNIQGDDLVFGSAIAFEEFVFPDYRIFCPYAYMDGSVANAFDLAQGYNYFEPDVEWYAAIKNTDYSNITVLRDVIDHGNVTQTAVEPMAAIEDGRWTYPYFDCGGGDIWMVTYSAPILGLRNVSGRQEVWFRGVATIDIELTNIDVNQCDPDDQSDAPSRGSLDVFRGTHSCQPTTQCRALTGYGFKRGSYSCVCDVGFYFPDISSTSKTFNGSDIESYYDNNNVTGDIAAYQCLRCARGCDACVDATPCMIEYNMVVRVTLLLLSVLLILAICGISFVTHQYRSQRVIKSASPIFLQVTLLGCLLMSCQMFLIFGEPNDAVCMTLPWFSYIGFALAYGALLLKTWRVSTIFRYGTTKRVHLPDKVLLQWMIPVVVITVTFLIAWTTVSPSTSVLIVTESELKYIYCNTDWWLTAAKVGEVVFLLWGVYLSFTVRKAPSQFNESKYISWTIYNAILLGTFMVVIIQLIALPQGPDIVYAMTFLYIQIRITFTLVLFFAPKFYSLYKMAKYPELAEIEENNGRTLYRTTIATVVGPAKLRQHAQNQTALSWVRSEQPIRLNKLSVDGSADGTSRSNGAAPPYTGITLTPGTVKSNQVAPTPGVVRELGVVRE